MSVTAIGRVLDYSARTIPGAQIHAAGYSGAIRYLPKPSPSQVATLTKAEYADLTKAGLQVGIVFEHNDRLRPLQGRTAGVQDGQWALRMAQEESLPVPPRCIFMAHDIWEAQYRTGNGLDAMRAYQDGAASVLGNVAAVYGFTEIVTAAHQDGTATKFWQCGRETDIAAHVNVYQQNYGQTTIAGVACDVNKILTPDWGQHPAPSGPVINPHALPDDEDAMYLIHELNGSRYCLLQGGRLIHLVTMDAVNDIRKVAAGIMEWPAKEIDSMLGQSK